MKRSNLCFIAAGLAGLPAWAGWISDLPDFLKWLMIVSVFGVGLLGGVFWSMEAASDSGDS